MSQFIESICCEDGRAKHLSWHQQRVNETYKEFFLTKPIDLIHIIPEIPENGRYKCRIVYNQGSFSVEFQKYQIRPIKSLKLVETEEIDYRFKYKDRTNLDDLFAQRAQCDDIIIVRDGLITDAYYANLAFYDGNDWFTPHRPLLKGTKLSRYLAEEKIKSLDLTVNDIKNFRKVSLINAMLDLDELYVPLDKVF